MGAALRSFKELPTPPGMPWLGQTLQVRPARMHQQLEQWARDLGPYYRVQLGPEKLLVVGDHQAVSQLLRDRPDGFRRTPRLQKIWVEMGLPIGLFGANGEVWKRQRRMVMAGFDPAHVRSYFGSMQGVSERLTGRWRKAAQAGASIDLQSDLMRYTVDTIAGLAFGAEVNTLESDADRIQQHLDKLFPAVFERLLRPLPTWRWWPSRADRELALSIVEIKAAVAGFIAQTRGRLQAQPELRVHPRNLLEAMIAAADQPDSGIDDEQVAGNVLTMLLAGEDTTANTLAWMIDLLWRNPATLQRARDEVRAAMAAPGGLDDVDRYAGLDFLEACTQETMRLKPVAPAMPFQALRDTVIGDVAVKAGTLIICLMRRDSVSETHVERAAAFEPERWLAEGAGTVHSAKRISMPFGAGPRICPGRYLALLEIKMAMAALLGHFDIESIGTPDGGPAPERMAFTMAPVGLAMRLRERLIN
ncbi:cytochrome P450 [Pelomonas sp. SE-A7]|uniref:cytochrome P450 n=1 Tax=Pelomonas sp. SE-A7 TaxID=3054953 RepID=UPI00259D2A8E|nr:cytochrome P450 [Pelomonas sp. SE-A7]MDM4768349.1 cytochrome P450 [Pelomonas sp. SE-A7]